jgi:hypothetical protein
MQIEKDVQPRLQEIILVIYGRNLQVDYDCYVKKQILYLFQIKFFLP